MSWTRSGKLFTRGLRGFVPEPGGAGTTRFLREDASWEVPAGGGGGDVTAAANLGDNLLIRGDGAVKGVQNSGITVDDSDNVSGVGGLIADGVVDFGGATSVEIPNNTTISTLGQIDIAQGGFTWNGQFQFFPDEELALSAVRLAAITVEDPDGSEDIGIFKVPLAVTVRTMHAVLVGSDTPSVTWTIRHSSDRSAAGNEVVTGGTTTTSTTTGSFVSAFNDATIPSSSWIWLETTAQSGTVTQITVVINYTEDPS